MADLSLSREAGAFVHYRLVPKSPCQGESIVINADETLPTLSQYRHLLRLTFSQFRSKTKPVPPTG